MRLMYSAGRSKEKENEQVYNIFRSYLFNPLKSGLSGFALFLGFLTVIKYISVLIGSQPVFTIDIADISLSGLGFILFSLLKFLENFRDKEM
ncbi:MAG: hypothetical protein ACM34K_10740 [Bacillota bacterium]